MKQIFSLAFIMFVAIAGINAKDKERVSPHVKATSQNISISYGQPSMKGRTIFGSLVPYGQVWRAGADEATEITMNKAALFGGQQLRKGTFTLFVIPEKDHWTVIVNRKLGQWGAFSYEENKGDDLFRFDVPVTKLDQPAEKLTYKVTDQGVAIEWERTAVMIPVRILE